MQLTSSVICLTVPDVEASGHFLVRHFGYSPGIAADGFASFRHDGAPDVVFHRRGLEVLPADMRDEVAAGVIVAFVVDDLDAEHDRLRAEGAPVTLPLREEPWGERLFMVTDPNGVRYELASWATP